MFNKYIGRSLATFQKPVTVCPDFETAEAEPPILWPPDARSWLIEKDTDSGKHRRQEEKGMTEDEMDGWHHQLNGHEFEQAPGDGEENGSLACCTPWFGKELDTAERLNNSNKYH